MSQPSHSLTEIIIVILLSASYDHTFLWRKENSLLSTVPRIFLRKTKTDPFDGDLISDRVDRVICRKTVVNHFCQNDSWYCRREILHYWSSRLNVWAKCWITTSCEKEREAEVCSTWKGEMKRERWTVKLNGLSNSWEETTCKQWQPNNLSKSKVTITRKIITFGHEFWRKETHQGFSG